MCRTIRAFICLAWISFLVPLDAISEELQEWGPFFHQYRLTLEPGTTRTEVLGPLFAYQENEESHFWRFSPLLSYTKNEPTDFVEFDLLYPVLTYDRFGKESRFQLFQLFNFGGSQSVDESIRRQFTLFPFFFYQRSDNSEKNYTALVPFYGTLKNRVMRDEIFFVLFPLYSETRKRDVVTRNYLFPFFHQRRGPAVTGWQFWPLYGAEHRAVTTITNNYGDLEIVPGHDTRFVLWPFFLDSRLGLGSENPQHQQAILPFYSYLRSPQRDSTTYLWPLGYTHTVDRERNYEEWAAPWPLVVFARGEGKTVNRIWPLFSRASNTNLTSEFYLWPIYKSNRATADPLSRHRVRILFFLYSDLVEKNTTTGTSLHRTDLWPLFTARRDHLGNEYLQILAPFEPLIPNNKSIERNYSPLWSIWRSAKNARTGVASKSLLWNLYREDTTPTTKKCSLLLGLFQYQSGPEGKRWRIFFVPFGARQPDGQRPQTH